MIRGRQPKFFEGDAKAFTGLYFNLDDETFEFFAPLKMKDNSLWIDVTNLMKTGSGKLIGQIAQNSDLTQNLSKYINRLNSVDNIKEIDLHIEEVTGEDKTIDVVVDIFNDVNSGGTKLSKRISRRGSELKLPQLSIALLTVTFAPRPIVLPQLEPPFSVRD